MFLDSVSALVSHPRISLFTDFFQKRIVKGFNTKLVIINGRVLGLAAFRTVDELLVSCMVVHF